MPMYQYHCPSCGVHFDAVASLAERTKPQECGCGKMGNRVFDAPGAAAPGIWPMVSELALAVDPSQVGEANARAKRHGVGVEYRPDGAAVIADRKARKQLLKLEGFHDRRGGYGD